MADSIEVPFVHLADATTKTQQAKVDAAGNQYAVVTGTTAVSGTVSVDNFDGSGAYPIAALPTGVLRVATEPTQLFNDSFPTDATIDTNRWVAPTASGGGVLAATSVGTNLTLGSGTTAGGYSYLQSIPNFGTVAPSFLSITFLIKFEYPVLTPSTRFFGIGTSPATPTVTSSLTDGVGFEIYTDGKMYAVMYNGGTRTVIQDLSAATGNGKQPADANFHLYAIYFRTTKCFWYIDNIITPVASETALQISNDTLPVKLSVVAGTTPSQSNVINCYALAVGDLAGNNRTLSDGTYPWQRAAVSSTGALSTSVVGTVAVSGSLSAAPPTDGRLTTTLAAATLNSSAQMTLGAGQGTVTFQITGNTNGATISFQGSVDSGTTWSLVNALVPSTGVFTPSTNASSFFGKCNVAGYQYFRLIVTATSAAATITVNMESSIGDGLIALSDPIPAGSNNIGTVTLGNGSIGNQLGTVAIYGFQADSYGNLLVGMDATPLPAGTNNIGTVTVTDGSAGSPVTGTIVQVNPTYAISANVTIAGNVTMEVSGSNYTQQFAFQASTDSGTTWFNVAGARADGSASESTTLLLTNATQAWHFSVPSMTNIRVYATQVNNGTSSWRITQGTALYMPNPAVTLGTGSNTIGSVMNYDGSGAYPIIAIPTGVMRVATEPTQLFNDSFPTDSSLDTTYRWAAPVASGGGVLATATTGTDALILGSGTTTGGYSYVYSQPAFGTVAPSFLSISFLLRIEYPVQTPATRFWGIGTTPGSPTVTSSTTDGVGFEVYTDGKMYAVMYNLGVRTVIQDLSAATGNGKQPSDGNYHLYAVYFRTTKCFWYIDSMETPVAIESALKIGNDQLPMKYSVVAGTSPASSIIIDCYACAIGDLAGNNRTLSDGTYPWQRAAVLAKGTQGSYGLATQDLKDSGRTTLQYFVTNVAAGTSTTETAITLTRAAGTAATTTATSFVITSGKTFRITSLTFASRGNTGSGVAQITTFSLRINTSGAVSTSTTPIVLQVRSATPATIAAWDRFQVPLPDGLEFQGNGTIQFGITANAVYSTSAPTWDVFMTGFEY